MCDCGRKFKTGDIVRILEGDNEGMVAHVVGYSAEWENYPVIEFYDTEDCKHSMIIREKLLSIIEW